MNTLSLSLLLCPLLAFALPAAGQEPPPQGRPRVVPPPVPSSQPPRPAENSGLPHNVKLTLEGSLLGAIPTDFSVTTGAPRVTTDLPMELKGDAPVIGTFEAVLIPGEPWQVQVSLGARVPIPVGNGNLEYRDLRLNTTVRIAPGKQVVLWQKGEQKLTLSVEKVEE